MRIQCPHSLGVFDTPAAFCHQWLPLFILQAVSPLHIVFVKSHCYSQLPGVHSAAENAVQQQLPAALVSWLLGIPAGSS